MIPDLDSDVVGFGLATIMVKAATEIFTAIAKEFV